MKDPVVAEITLLEGYVGRLKELRERDVLADPHLRGSLERHLHLAAECAIDVGELLIARDRLPRPGTYKEVFRVLEERGILPPELARRFRDIAGLRNLLVHAYEGVDPARLLEYLDQLDDFKEFSRCVAEHVRKTGSRAPP